VGGVETGIHSTNWPWTTFRMRSRLRGFRLRDYRIVRHATRSADARP
jgi:hypothetical protein